jgi:hypothetical protein
MGGAEDYPGRSCNLKPFGDGCISAAPGGNYGRLYRYFLTRVG